MEKITDSTFDETVLNAEGLVLVDFYTDSCGPCRLLAPVLEELSKEMDSVSFVKFDASKGETPNTFSISAVPTLILFDSGGEVDRLVGLSPKSKLKAWLEKYTSN